MTLFHDYCILFLFGATATSGPEHPNSRGIQITLNDAPQSVGLLWTSDSARRRDFYLKTHNTHNRETSMPPVGFEPTISAGERSQTYALDRAATDCCRLLLIYFKKSRFQKLLKILDCSIHSAYILYSVDMLFFSPLKKVSKEYRSL